MNAKILLIALSAAAFSSCSTAYKSGQTPDDVYYSPVRYTEGKQDNDRDEVKNKPAAPTTDYSISMGIRDRRWRDFRDDYDYDNSPYNYACNKYNYGYYYNPYYYPWAIYTGKTSYSKPVNTTPRMVNLNAYKNYNSNVATGKTTGTGSWFKPSDKYNNSNSDDNNGRRNRVIIFPNNNNSSSNNNTRTYTPSSSGSSSSGSSSSGSSSSGSSVSRPGRGG
jgi:hypothetical protein